MNIVDSLVVTLGLDTSGLKQGAKEATSTVTKMSTEITAAAEAGEKAQVNVVNNVMMAYINFAKEQKKTADSAVQNNKRIGSSVDSIAASGEKAIRTFGALFLLFAGAHSVKSFVTDMLGVDAALGRTAKSIGQTPEALSGIGRAVERMGGTFNGAVGGLKGLSDAFESMRTTGSSAIMEPMARLQGLSGRAITFGKDVHANFLSIADALHALQAKDGPMADYLGRQILGDEGLTNLAKGGSAAVRAAEAQSFVTKKQTEDAQKLQEQLTAVRQGFQDIGNAILMDFGPAMIRAATYVKDLLDRYRPLIETKVSEWVKDVGHWFAEHRTDVENFGKAVGSLATAAGSLAIAFASQSPMMQALEAFAVLMGGTVLRAVTAVSAAATALGSIPVPAWALAALGLSAAAQWQGAKDTAKILGSDDPTKNDVVVDPESGMATKVGEGEGNQGTGPNTGFSRNGAGGAWAWLKSKLGFGGDPKTRDAISDTAKATTEMRDLMKAQKEGLGSGFGGVASSSGGLGGSGRHVDGSGPGASLRDRQFHGKGNFGEKGWWTPERQDHAIDVLMKEAGLTEDGAKALVSRWKYVESPGGPGAVNPHSGAEGIAQWLGTRKGDGSRGTFDEQLKKVARELNGAENRAKSLLNTPGKEATGASAFERAEGYNARTGEDNFTARTREGMKHIVHGAAGVATANASGVGQAPTGDAVGLAMSMQGMGEGESARALGHIMHAGQWCADFVNGVIEKSGGKGSGSAMADSFSKWGKAISTGEAKRGDVILENDGPGTRTHHVGMATGNLKRDAQGNVTHVEMISGNYGHMVRKNWERVGIIAGMRRGETGGPTIGHAVRHALGAIAHANKMLHHEGGAVPVEVTDKSAEKIGKSGRAMLHDRRWGAQHAHVTHGLDRAFGRSSALDRMTRLAAMGAYHHTINHADNRSDTRIGSITVQTSATDARGIAADIEPHLHRGQAAGRADYGLA